MELDEAMRSTGTCRYYRPDPIPDAACSTAFDAARFAPQGGNRQPVRWIVVRDRALKQALADLYLPHWEAYFGSSTVVSNARGTTASAADHFAHHLVDVPALLVLCAEIEALHPTDAALDRVSVVGGASIYPTMQNVCLALRDRGVATAVTTLLCREEPAVKELLGVPDGFLTAAHVAAGYPERPFPRKLSRASVEETVSLDRFDRPLFGSV